MMAVLSAGDAGATEGAEVEGGGEEDDITTAVEDVVTEAERRLLIDAAAARWALTDSRHFSTKEAARCCGRP